MTWEIFISATIGFFVGYWTAVYVWRTTSGIYRRWYLDCRQALESIAMDGNPKLNQRIAQDVLDRIGPRKV